MSNCDLFFRAISAHIERLVRKNIGRLSRRILKGSMLSLKSEFISAMIGDTKYPITIREMDVKNKSTADWRICLLKVVISPDFVDIRRSGKTAFIKNVGITSGSSKSLYAKP
jgi:hypothetical protein